MDNLFVDPGLDEISSMRTKQSFKYLLISDRIKEIVAANINLVWVTKNYKKTHTPAQILENAKKIFANPELQKSNTLWTNHLASSLRELCDSDTERDSKGILKLVPSSSGTESEATLWARYRLFRKFLNDHAHLKISGLALAKEILEDDQLEAVTDEHFDTICTEYIYHLEKLFTHKNKS